MLMVLCGQHSCHEFLSTEVLSGPDNTVFSAYYDFPLPLPLWSRALGGVEVEMSHWWQTAPLPFSALWLVVEWPLNPISKGLVYFKNFKLITTLQTFSSQWQTGYVLKDLDVFIYTWLILQLQPQGTQISTLSIPIVLGKTDDSRS